MTINRLCRVFASDEVTRRDHDFQESEMETDMRHGYLRKRWNCNRLSIGRGESQ